MTAGHPGLPGLCADRRSAAGTGPSLSRESILTGPFRRSASRPASVRLLAPVVLAVAVVAAGCGTTSAAPTPSSSARGGTSSFRQCLENHGVTPPTGRPSGGTPHARPTGAASNSFRKAIQACGGSFGGGGFGGRGFGGG
jgi:hypothetical protein